MVGNANANGVPFIKNGTSFLKDNIVLWYDIERQGATNENMAINPILKDLSGNGHDATCYNFDWSGQSGIGSYATNFDVNNDRANIEILGTQKWLVKNIINTRTPQPILSRYDLFSGFDKTVTVVVDGIPDTASINAIKIRFGSTSINLHNGQNTIAFGEPITTGFVVFHFVDISLTNITIEILPEYPNALVSDGVDDCCIVDGLPILTDYTVIAKRKWIKTKYDTFATFSSKSSSTTNGEFIFERFNLNNNLLVYSFGAGSNFETFAENITYQTSTSYNGKTINKGNLLGNDRLTLFGLRGAIQCSNIALYSFVLFNRTLTEDEIKKWIRINMDKDYLLPNEVN